MKKTVAVVLFFLAGWLLVIAIMNRITAPGLTAIGFLAIGAMLWSTEKV
ncbi:hypothetical protein [Robertkochia flava]|nr:hypothetical protein [Robertkochia marina]